MAATNVSPNLETEDPEGSWVERSSVLINELSPMEYNFLGSKIISAIYIME